MENWSLKEISSLFGEPIESDVIIKDICTDTRKITENCLFVALAGERFDGHDFVAQALEKGAAAAVCSKPVKGAQKPVIMVKDTERALLTLGCAYRMKYDIPVIAVTGSVGKTTTKDMIACAVSAGLKTLKTEGNLNNEIGLPMTLLGLNKTYECAVIEMGMCNMGEIEVLSNVTLPEIGVITNIGVSHMENLGSRENILKAKLEITKGMKQGAPLILNYDNDLLSDIKSYEGFDIISYGVNNKSAQITAENIKSNGLSTEFDISFKGKLYPAKIPCVGEHNVLNALAAFGCAYCLGLNLENSIKALEGYVPSGMRQKIVEKGGITVIEDCYNASPDSMNAAIKTLASVGGGKKIAVLADMLELGKISDEAHLKVGTLAAENKIDMVIAYGDKAKYIAEGANKGGINSAFASSKEQAFSLLKGAASKGDTVLFKGSRGMKLEDIITMLYNSLDE